MSTMFAADTVLETSGALAARPPSLSERQMVRVPLAPEGEHATCAAAFSKFHVAINRSQIKLRYYPFT